MKHDRSGACQSFPAFWSIISLNSKFTPKREKTVGKGQFSIAPSLSACLDRRAHVRDESSGRYYPTVWLQQFLSLQDGSNVACILIVHTESLHKHVELELGSAQRKTSTFGRCRETEEKWYRQKPNVLGAKGSESLELSAKLVLLLIGGQQLQQLCNLPCRSFDFLLTVKYCRMSTRSCWAWRISKTSTNLQRRKAVGRRCSSAKLIPT